MAAMFATLLRDRATPGLWTGYNAALERSVLDTGKYMAEAPQQNGAKPASSAAAKATKQSSAFGQALLSAFDVTKEST